MITLEIYLIFDLIFTEPPRPFKVRADCALNNIASRGQDVSLVAGHSGWWTLFFNAYLKEEHRAKEQHIQNGGVVQVTLVHDDAEWHIESAKDIKALWKGFKGDMMTPKGSSGEEKYIAQKFDYKEDTGRRDGFFRRVKERKSETVALVPDADARLPLVSSVEWVSAVSATTEAKAPPEVESRSEVASWSL